jgi:trans-aconitate methyltransferase
MSDSRILDQLDCAQYNAPIGGTRFLSCHIRDGADIRNWSRDKHVELWSQATHVHAIPATAQVEKILSQLRPGQILALDGQLVEVQDDKGHTLLTSSTILGDSNCEVMWVESVQLFD